MEDDDGCRALLTGLLSDEGYTVLEASTGAEALEQLGRAHPALVVLDVQLPDVSGYEVCRIARRQLGDEVAVFIVSGARVEASDRVAGLLLGADDYLTKPFAPDELLVRVGGLLRRRARSTAPSSGLTAREEEVLRLLALGSDQAEIARALVISQRTVTTHIERILRKLGAHSRAEAVALAYRLGLVPIPA